MKKSLKIIEHQFAPFILAIAAGLTVFLANSNVTGPMIQPDEGSYLAIAAAIAGYPNDLAGSYFAGYPILIAPAFWIADLPQDIWGAVRAINATLFAITVFGLWLLASHVAPTHTLRKKYIAVIIVSLYPAWVVIAGYSSSQMAFIPVFLFMVLAYLRAIHNGIRSWLTLGVTTGFLYWIHPTAVAPVIAVLIGAGFIAFKRRRYDLFVVLLLTIISMIFIYRYGISVWVQNKMTISGLPANIHYPDMKQFLSSLLTIKGINEIITRIAGQLFYFSLGTVGLLWLGLFALTPNLKTICSRLSINKIPDSTVNQVLLKETALAILIWLSLIGTVMLTALMFSSTPSAQRLDHWFYGRYVEGVIAPILLAGALSVSYKKVLWVVPISIFCALILFPEVENYVNIVRVNIPAFWQDYFLREQGLWSWLATGIIILIAVALFPHRISVFIILSVFIFSNYLHINWHVDTSIKGASRNTAALTIREKFNPGTCVGFEYSSIDTYNKQVFWFDFGFTLYDYALQRIGFEHWLDSCDGPLFSYNKNLNKRNTSVYLLTTSPHDGPLVWMKK
jgi:hypothetical protein